MTYHVCYADTDAAGVVYHGRYVEMAERSRVVSVNEAGFSAQDWDRIRELGFVVRGVHTKHHQFARLHDQLTIRSFLHELTRARGWWISRVFRQDQPICTVAAEVVFFHHASQQPVLLSDELHQAFVARGFVRPDPHLRRTFPWIRPS